MSSLAATAAETEETTATITATTITSSPPANKINIAYISFAMWDILLLIITVFAGNYKTYEEKICGAGLIRVELLPTI